MDNLRKVINDSINEKNKVKNFMLIDCQKTYRVIKMMARYWKCGVREAYNRYADFIYN